MEDTATVPPSLLCLSSSCRPQRLPTPFVGAGHMIRSTPRIEHGAFGDSCILPVWWRQVRVIAQSWTYMYIGGGRGWGMVEEAVGGVEGGEGLTLFSDTLAGSSWNVSLGVRRASLSVCVWSSVLAGQGKTTLGALKRKEKRCLYVLLLYIWRHSLQYNQFKHLLFPWFSFPKQKYIGVLHF